MSKNNDLGFFYELCLIFIVCIFVANLAADNETPWERVFALSGILFAVFGSIYYAIKFR